MIALAEWPTGICRAAAPAAIAAVFCAACGKQPQPVPSPPAKPAPVAPAPAAPAPAAIMPAPVPAPVAIAAVVLGSAIGADYKVTAPTATFAPKDTIYAAVSTTGAASTATLIAKWTYQDGRSVGEKSETIAPIGPAVTTFDIRKTDGFPAGKYKVEISLNGTVAASKDFEVK